MPDVFVSVMRLRPRNEKVGGLIYGAHIDLTFTPCQELVKKIQVEGTPDYAEMNVSSPTTSLRSALQLQTPGSQWPPLSVPLGGSIPLVVGPSQTILSNDAGITAVCTGGSDLYCARLCAVLDGTGDGRGNPRAGPVHSIG
jgi:hypothetical protein